MDGFPPTIQNFFEENGPVLIFLACGMLLAGLGGTVFFRLQKYMRARHLPEDSPSSPVQEWWSGLMLSGSVALQLGAQFLFFLPMLIGLAAVTIVEYYYMVNPEKAPWIADVRGDGLIILSIGLLLLGAGIHYRKGKIPFLLRTSGVFYYINRIENMALIYLVGIGLLFTLISIFFIRPFPLFCIILCIPISIAAVVVLTWLLEDTDIPGRYEFDQNPKITFDRSFRLSKIKDPSEKAGQD